MCLGCCSSRDIDSGQLLRAVVSYFAYYAYNFCFLFYRRGWGGGRGEGRGGRVKGGGERVFHGQICVATKMSIGAIKVKIIDGAFSLFAALEKAS